jgi:dihydroxy-acid dehydratase
MMEEFYYAGGLPAVMSRLLSRLNQKAMTVTGKTVSDNVQEAPCYNDEVIASLEKPIKSESGIAVVTGNLCQHGAIIKPSAATPELMIHKGPAVVFEDIEDYKARIDDPNLPVTPKSILVLKNVGPKGYPGMPEVGNMGLPKKILKAGVSDMVRISDGRMSGTAFGTVFLHTSPEAASGGNLALVKDGDLIEVDVPQRRLILHVSDDELAARRQSWKAPDLGYDRGYVKLYIDTVQEAHLGADLDFLRGSSGSQVTRDSH